MGNKVIAVNEARITINGVELTQSQSSTIRVAVASFVFDLEENGLGDDERGRSITQGYLRRLSEITSLIRKKQT